MLIFAFFKEKIDALELDALLSEMTLIATRSELYWRFLKRRLGEAPVRPLSESSSPSEKVQLQKRISSQSIIGEGQSSSTSRSQQQTPDEVETVEEIDEEP